MSSAELTVCDMKKSHTTLSTRRDAGERPSKALVSSLNETPRAGVDFGDFSRFIAGIPSVSCAASNSRFRLKSM
jgi:hypothetical protein